MMEHGLDNAPGYYFSFNDEGKILELNASLCTDLGYSKEELLGKKLETLFSIPSSIFYQTHFFPVLKYYGRAEEIFISLQKKDKEWIPVLMNARRDEVDGRNINICLCITVPNREKFEKELITAKKEIEKAVRENTELVQAKNEIQKHAEELDASLQLLERQHAELKQFNRVITHDLQEPLRKLSIFSNMILSATETTETKIAKQVSKLLNASEQMRLTISGLQQYIWLTETPVSLTEVDINKLLLVIRNELQAEFNIEEVQVETEDLPAIRGDWDQLKLLFYHILSNSIKFKKADEPLKVHVKGTILQKNVYRSLRKYNFKDYLKIQVKDNGVGFEVEFKTQVFQLFRKLHGGKGKGLGLALAKKIVENHGGLIDADSSPNVGTTITVLLPIFE